MCQRGATVFSEVFWTDRKRLDSKGIGNLVGGCEGDISLPIEPAGNDLGGNPGPLRDGVGG